MSDDGYDEVASLVPRGTLDRLQCYVELLRAAASSQNLISPSTVPQIWRRHILDSLQLVRHADGSGRWVDIGAGAGLPGMVVAIASDRPVTLIEPRRLRVGFLQDVASKLGLSHRVDVCCGKSETMTLQEPAAVVSARAVATLEKLFGMAHHLTDDDTLWLLSKGRAAAAEVAQARLTWQGDFRLVPSLTDPEAMIVAASHIRRRAQQ